MFAYGATGAGKTHTMLGSTDEPGVMYRTMKEMFKRMEDFKEEKVFEMAFSYLEVNIIEFIFLQSRMYSLVTTSSSLEWLTPIIYHAYY